METLRGPQGTLFGSGSVGGTVRYITNQPKIGAVEGQVEAGVNFLSGGGGLVSTADDWLAFARMLLNAGGRLLTPTSVSRSVRR